MNCYFTCQNYQNSLKPALLRLKKLHWPRLIWPTWYIYVIMTYKWLTAANILVFMLTILYSGKIILNIYIKVIKVCWYVYKLRYKLNSQVLKHCFSFIYPQLLWC